MKKSFILLLCAGALLAAGAAAVQARMYIHTHDGRTITVDVDRRDVKSITYDDHRRGRRDDRGRHHQSWGVRIINAEYGQRDRWCDATAKLERECAGRIPCRFQVDNGLCGDTIKNVVKEVIVDYRCPNGDLRTVRAREGQRASLDCR